MFLPRLGRPKRPKDGYGRLYVFSGCLILSEEFSRAIIKWLPASEILMHRLTLPSVLRMGRDVKRIARRQLSGIVRL